MSGELTRRSAARAALAVVAGGVAGFAVTRNSSAARQKPGTTAANAYGAGSNGSNRELGPVAQVPLGGGRILTRPPIVLVRSATGTVHAFSSICTHQGCPVSTIANGTIDCPCHGSKFDLATGRVVAGPAPRALPAVAVSVRGGEIYRA